MSYERWEPVSYERWGEDGSDVCVFAAEYGDTDQAGRYVTTWVCMDCKLSETAENFTCGEPGVMLKHLHAHHAVGHTVPERAFKRLKAESEGKSQ